MTPNQRAHQVCRSYSDISNTLSLGEWIARAIRDAEQDAYKSVLAIVEQHQKHDTFAHLDELEGQIKQAMTDP
jgi:hypothetical protein